MDEWLEVIYPAIRDVLVDDTICGTTNKPMMVQRGHHTITLGGDQDYTSPPMPVAIFNTTKHDPLLLMFEPK